MYICHAAYIFHVVHVFYIFQKRYQGVAVPVARRASPGYAHIFGGAQSLLAHELIRFDQFGFPLAPCVIRIYISPPTKKKEISITYYMTYEKTIYRERESDKTRKNIYMHIYILYTRQLDYTVRRDG